MLLVQNLHIILSVFNNNSKLEKRWATLNDLSHNDIFNHLITNAELLS